MMVFLIVETFWDSDEINLISRPCVVVDCIVPIDNIILSIEVET
jgi:hypothetical protein